MATIRDIAKLSGYSVSSVSRVINQHPHVSKEAREKIQNVIDSLNYKPNILAQELSAGKTYKLGVVMPQSRHPYFQYLLDGLLDQAQKTHYSLLILPSQYQRQLEADYLEQLRGHAFDGLIFTSRTIELETIQNYTQYGPIVVCEQTSYDNLSQLYLDRRSAYLDIYQSLYAKGYKKMALLFTRADDSSATYRESLSAYHQVFGEGKTDFIQTFGKISTYEDGYRLGQKLCQNQSIEVIFANSDDVAAGVYQAYQEARCSLPFIIGQEKQLASQLLNFSTIDHKAYELGCQAVDALLSDQVVKKVFQSKVVKR